jgi:sphingomyelin phosphodiesterase 2
MGVLKARTPSCAIRSTRYRSEASFPFFPNQENLKPHSQGGDFNCLPTSLPITIIRDHAGLIDAWAVTDHSSEAPSTSSNPRPRRSNPSALEAIRRYGITADSPLNSYTAGKPLDAHARRYFGKRLDYIFYRQAIRPYARPDDPMLKAIETKVVLTERVPQYEFSFSDHFGVECTFDIGPPEGEVDPTSSMGESGLSQASLSATIQTLTSAYRLSLARARKELFLFLFCLVVLVGAITGSAWIPHYWINPICVSVAAVVTWLGTTMLYEGVIYGRWEQNALRSLIEELEVPRRGLELRAQAPRRSAAVEN